MPTMRQLLQQARIDLDDPEHPGLGDDEDSRWRNAELTDYLNRALDEACLRSRLLVDTGGIDDDGVGYGAIPIVAGTRNYRLDGRIVRVLRAKLAGEPCTLMHQDVAHLDMCHCGWEDDEGTPRAYITNRDHRDITLYPTPTESGTLELQVQRLELSRFEYPSDLDREPEFHQFHHWNLVHWITHLAYLKRDPDTYDKDKARDSAQMFAEFFGPRDDAWEHWELRGWRPHYVRGHFQ